MGEYFRLDSSPIIAKATDDHRTEDSDSGVRDGVKKHEAHPAPTLEVKKHLYDLLEFEDFCFQTLLIGSEPLFRVSIIIRVSQRGWRLQVRTSTAITFSSGLSHLHLTGLSGNTKKLG